MERSKTTKALVDNHKKFKQESRREKKPMNGEDEEKNGASQSKRSV